jgi:excinuclease ABC subunit A
MAGEYLIIEGARQNNLKGIHLKIPHNQVTVITGVSGSGKSSLAFDTLFAEGQWRYIESLSTYARMFLEKVDRPVVDQVENIRPTIAIQQKNTVRSARSTVGTATEIYDYLRLLFAKVGKTFCSGCGQEVRFYSPDSIAEHLIQRYAGERALILFPIPVDQGKDSAILSREYLRKGFIRLKIGQEMIDLSQEPVPNLKDMGSCYGVADRVIIKQETTARLVDSLESAYREGNGITVVEVVDKDLLKFGQGFCCQQCGQIYEKPQPLLFSFNHPLGACPECKGFGQILKYDEDLIVPDKSLSLAKGAIEPWTKPSHRWWYRQFLEAAKDSKIDLQKPYGQLSQKDRGLIFKGNKQFEGVNAFFEYLETKRYKLHVRVFLSRYRSQFPCPSCQESRLKSQALRVKLQGLNIQQVCNMAVKDSLHWLLNLPLTQHERSVAAEVLRQLEMKLSFLKRVGLGYLTLNRQTRTLSGGEAQRINLSNQLGSRLAGTLYVLDEPSIGLHPRDTQMLSDIIRDLAKAGNTVVVVEHDRGMIQAADHVIELGPGGGEKGGQVTFAGPLLNFLNYTDSLTAKYLKDIHRIPIPKARHKGTGHVLALIGARERNLKGIDLKLPLGMFTCITGVSGSGKSTLIHDTLYHALARAFRTEFQRMGRFDRLSGAEHLKGVKLIDQEPIGRTPRSNPVTYMKAFDEIRRVFAEQNEAKRQGLTASHFSFNVPGGRCDACQGNGYQKLEMYFFEDIYATCSSCEGRRFKAEVLRVKYRGLDIGQVLNLTVEEALAIFTAVPALQRKFKVLSNVGLGYLRLGQPATTLSGGEAQRLKICFELANSQMRDHLFILDEPTTGLHFQDIQRLLKVLMDLVDAGNTVVVIEHNLDVIKTADWIIDLGPEGGEAGGEIIAEGTPEEVIQVEHSYTGRFLKEYLTSLPASRVSAVETYHGLPSP